MQQPTNPPSRKKFIWWGAAVFTSLATLRFFTRTKEKDRKNNTVKMLTQDGQLVEVDKNLLGPARKKISNAELQQWVKK
jgi:hypothetical protein